MAEAEPLRHHHEVMGTVVSFLVEPRVATDRDEVATLIESACAELDRLDAIFSTYREGSPLNRLRRGEVGVSGIQPQIGLVLELCRTARERSGGWFDPWAMPGGVDPTGMVKGWAVEQAVGKLRSHAVASALVNGAGDIATCGAPPGGGWLVGIQHPWRQESLACLARLVPGVALATSGTYQRGRHLVDPRSGDDAAAMSGVVSASVSGPSLAFADAYATALAVAGVSGLAAPFLHDGYDAYLITADGGEEATSSFPFAVEGSAGCGDEACASPET